MLRSILFIKTAIAISHPSLNEDLRERYARVIQEEAQEHKHDPVTVIAMVEGESRWQAGLVGGLNGQCVGLGQHCLHVYDYCTGTNYRGARCQEKKQWLLNGVNNLRATSEAITEWRRYCRRVTGKPALFARWLYGYQGHAVTKTKKCGMRKTRNGWVDLPRPALVKRVMNRRIALIKATERRLR